VTIIHCITIPVGQKFKYTKLTVPFTAWKIPENDVMALEASDRLFESFESIVGVPVDVFQGLPSNSVPLCFISWEYQIKSAKTSERNLHLHKSGSSLGAISKHLKVPRSSVQTIVRKNKHHGTTQPSYRSGRRRILSPRDGRTLV
jgi:hypothetical protein